MSYIFGVIIVFLAAIDFQNWYNTFGIVGIFAMFSFVLMEYTYSDMTFGGRGGMEFLHKRDRRFNIFEVFITNILRVVVFAIGTVLIGWLVNWPISFVELLSEIKTPLIMYLILTFLITWVAWRAGIRDYRYSILRFNEKWVYLGMASLIVVVLIGQVII